MPEHTCTRTVCHEHVQVNFCPCLSERPSTPTARLPCTFRLPRSCGRVSHPGNCSRIAPCRASLSSSKNSVWHAAPHARESPCCASRAWSSPSEDGVRSSAWHDSQEQ